MQQVHSVITFGHMDNHGWLLYYYVHTKIHIYATVGPVFPKLVGFVFHNTHHRSVSFIGDCKKLFNDIRPNLEQSNSTVIECEKHHGCLRYIFFLILTFKDKEYLYDELLYFILFVYLNSMNHITLQFISVPVRRTSR